MVEAYQVGSKYRVPVVYAKYCDRDAWWPVLGGFHEDAEHIGFEPWHWHVDVRFIAPTEFKRLEGSGWSIFGNYQGSKGRVKREATHVRQFFARRVPILLRPGQDCREQFSAWDHPKPVLHLRTCYRQWEYSWPMSSARWIDSLQAAYADKTLAKGHCPHRGADLSTLPVDATGCIECPLHGLVFEADSGRMVPRNEWEERRRVAGL